MPRLQFLRNDNTLFRVFKLFMIASPNSTERRDFSATHEFRVTFITLVVCVATGVTVLRDK